MDEEQREPRRGARIAASFWIGIEGIDSQPTLRQGNLSATGMYFEVGEAVGPTGSVQFLHIESEDHRAVVQVLARIIRTSVIDDIDTGHSIGLAMEFMPSSAEGRMSLERLVRHVVELGLRQEAHVDHRFDVDVTGIHHADRTNLQHLSIQRLTLETDWNATVGDTLHLQIQSPHTGAQSFPLQGQVTNVKSADEGYVVDIQITGSSAQPTQNGVQSSVLDEEVGIFTDLITQPVEDFALPAPEHLSGLLSRIKLPTILGLMEMERMSGELRFTNDHDQEMVLYIDTGMPVDLVDASGKEDSPKELLKQLMGWADGEFRFLVEKVSREDRFGTSMTSLILELARLEDEASQDDSQDHDADIDLSDLDF